MDHLGTTLPSHSIAKLRKLLDLAAQQTEKPRIHIATWFVFYFFEMVRHEDEYTSNDMQDTIRAKVEEFAAADLPIYLGHFVGIDQNGKATTSVDQIIRECDGLLPEADECWRQACEWVQQYLHTTVPETVGSVKRLLALFEILEECITEVSMRIAVWLIFYYTHSLLITDPKVQQVLRSKVEEFSYANPPMWLGHFIGIEQKEATTSIEQVISDVRNVTVAGFSRLGLPSV